MKHTLPITIVFMVLFIVSQAVGLFFVNYSAEEIVTEEGTQIVFGNTSLGERPEVEGTESLIFIIIGVVIGTLVLLLFAKYKKVNWWKTWFFIAATMTMAISIGVITGEDLFLFAWIIAAGLAYWKIKKFNSVIHNSTEILMYSGIAVLLAPILNVVVMFILLIIVSIYDMYAVWKSKHMITLAKFTTKANLFPGISVSYKDEREVKSADVNTGPGLKKPSAKKSPGILGGGDIVFPLLFSSTVMIWLLGTGMSKLSALSFTFIITITTAFSLFALFFFSKKDRFYPAMPFVTAGCFLGYLIVWLLV